MSLSPSLPPSMKTLPLPLEVFSRIYTYLPKESLANLALASRVFLPSTDSVLWSPRFRRVIRSKDDIERWIDAVQRRNVVTAIMIVDVELAGQVDDEDLWSEFEDALYKCPNLREMTVGGTLSERTIRHLRPKRLDTLSIKSTISIDSLAFSDYIDSLRSLQNLYIPSNFFLTSKSFQAVQPIVSTRTKHSTTPSPSNTLSTPHVYITSPPLSRPSLQFLLGSIHVSEEVQSLSLEVEECGLGIMQTVTLSPSTKFLRRLEIRGGLRDVYGASTLLKDLPPLLKRLPNLRSFSLLPHIPNVASAQIWAQEQSLTPSYTSLSELKFPSQTMWTRHNGKDGCVWEIVDSGRGEREWWEWWELQRTSLIKRKDSISTVVSGDDEDELELESEGGLTIDAQAGSDKDEEEEIETFLFSSSTSVSTSPSPPRERRQTRSFTRSNSPSPSPFAVSSSSPFGRGGRNSTSPFAKSPSALTPGIVG